VPSDVQASSKNAFPSSVVRAEPPQGSATKEPGMVALLFKILGRNKGDSSPCSSPPAQWQRVSFRLGVLEYLLSTSAFATAMEFFSDRPLAHPPPSSPPLRLLSSTSLASKSSFLGRTAFVRDMRLRIDHGATGLPNSQLA
jgi:hypothetical protein